MMPRKKRQVQCLSLTPDNIENINNKGINLDEFNNWRYLISLQLKRVNHKMTVKNG